MARPDRPAMTNTTSVRNGTLFSLNSYMVPSRRSRSQDMLPSPPDLQAQHDARRSALPRERANHLIVAPSSPSSPSRRRHGGNRRADPPRRSPGGGRSLLFTPPVDGLDRNHDPRHEGARAA